MGGPILNLAANLKLLISVDKLTKPRVGAHNTMAKKSDKYKTKSSLARSAGAHFKTGESKIQFSALPNLSHKDTR